MGTRPFFQYGTNLEDRQIFTSTVKDKNNTLKRYFSSIEAEIYFGNKLMEDIHKFDFMIEEEKLPLTGYNSYYPCAFVPGIRMVKGSFVLNFTNGAYLSNTLREIDDSIIETDFGEYSTSHGNDIRNKALWSKSFDIMLGYGYYDTEDPTYNATCQMILGAQISGMQSVLDVTGSPILEVYTFIAKDFIDGEFNNDDKDDKDKKKDTITDTDTNNGQIKDDYDITEENKENNKEPSNKEEIHSNTTVSEVVVTPEGDINFAISNSNNQTFVMSDVKAESLTLNQMQSGINIGPNDLVLSHSLSFVYGAYSRCKLVFTLKLLNNMQNIVCRNIKFYTSDALNSYASKKFQTIIPVFELTDNNGKYEFAFDKDFYSADAIDKYAREKLLAYIPNCTIEYEAYINDVWYKFSYNGNLHMIDEYNQTPSRYNY